MINDTRHNTQHDDIRYNDTQHNAIQYKDTQHNDTKYNEPQHNYIQINDIQHFVIQHNDNRYNDSIMTLGIITFRITVSKKLTINLMVLMSLIWVQRFLLLC